MGAGACGCMRVCVCVPGGGFFGGLLLSVVFLALPALSLRLAGAGGDPRPSGVPSEVSGTGPGSRGVASPCG
eukprot:11262633-Prorocentrum_lima.AAC.1